MRASALAAFAVLFACGTPVAACEAGPAQLRLIDQRGEAFSLADLAGRPTLVTFIATRCTDACPIVKGVFGSVARDLTRTKTRANLVTITLDPNYDTPIVMTREARRFKAETRVWRFASGRTRDVRTLMRAFGVVTIRDEAGIPDEHTTFVYVLDARGRLARTLPLSTTFVRDAERIVREPALAATAAP